MKYPFQADIPCIMCNKDIDADTSNEICDECQEELEEFFNNANQVSGILAPIDWKLLYNEMSRGLITYNGYELKSVGDFPTFRRL